MVLTDLRGKNQSVYENVHSKENIGWGPHNRLDLIEVKVQTFYYSLSRMRSRGSPLLMQLRTGDSFIYIYLQLHELGAHSYPNAFTSII